MAGLIASRVLYQGESLLSFKLSVIALVGFFELVILGPLTMFTAHLNYAKRSGLNEYGTLATVYVADFDQKWVRGGAKGEEILGTADVQSLADLANRYAVIREMRLVPFALTDVARLAVATAAPALPLLLTIMPLHFSKPFSKETRVERNRPNSIDRAMMLCPFSLLSPALELLFLPSIASTSLSCW
jgi:hypothetical protein